MHQENTTGMEDTHAHAPTRSPKGAGQLLLHSHSPHSTSYRGLTARLTPPGVLAHAYKVWGRRTGPVGDEDILDTFLTNLESRSCGEKKKVDFEPISSCWAFVRVHIHTNAQTHRPWAFHNANKNQGQLI